MTGRLLERLRSEPGADPAAGAVTICCVPSTVRLRLAPAGYVAWDSTVTVRTRGSCGIPVPASVTVRLRPVAPA